MQVDLEKRLELIELQLQTEVLEKELLKKKNESLELRLNKLENIQQMMLNNFGLIKEENFLYQKEINSMCNVLKEIIGEEEEVLDRSNDINKKEVVSIVLSHQHNVNDCCIDLIINEINNNYSIVHIKTFQNIICNHPNLINGDLQNEIWRIIEQKLEGNLIEKQSCIEIIISISTLLYDIPTKIVCLLSDIFSNQFIPIELKSNILLIVSYLTDDQLQPFCKIIHHILSFCLNPLFLTENNYGTATIVISHILPLLPDQILSIIARDVISLGLWRVDFGEEWRNKNRIDPHSMISLLFRSKEIVTQLTSSFIQQTTCLEFILNHLELRSEESLQILYEVICLVPNKCTSFIDQLLQLYPFGGDTQSCSICCDIFLMYLPNLTTSSFELLKQQILLTIQPFIILDEKLKIKHQQILALISI